MRTRSIPAVLIAATAFFSIATYASAEELTNPPVKLGTEGSNPEILANIVAEVAPWKIPGSESSLESHEGAELLFRPGPGLETAQELELEEELPELVEDTEGPDIAGVLPTVVAATSGFAIGYAGTSFVMGLLNIDPRPSEPVGERASREANRWLAVPPNTVVWSKGGVGNITTPNAWGFQGYSENKGGGRTYSGGITNPEGGTCAEELFGGGEILWAPGWGEYPFGPCGGAKEELNYILWEPLRLQACESPCTGLELITIPKPETPIPTLGEVSENIKEELESEKYPAANRWANYRLDPHHFPNPEVTELEIKQKDRLCDRGTPLFEDPDRSLAPGAFEKFEKTPYSVTERPSGTGSEPVYMRYGTTDWEPARTKWIEEEKTPYLDAWGGWGYRHIVAKHGWNLLDSEETQIALNDDLFPTKTGPKNELWRYESPEINPISPTVGCNRVVIVDFEQEEGDPASRGIVTSYNEVVR
jgi:hypothetical protein